MLGVRLGEFYERYIHFDVGVVDVDGVDVDGVDVDGVDVDGVLKKQSRLSATPWANRSC